MLEAQFEISCSQCGGQEFRQIFPVPAATYHLYGPEDERAEPRIVSAAVYVCLGCGHLEKFIDTSTLESPGGSLDERA
jgi:hypothetical protein